MFLGAWRSRSRVLPGAWQHGEVTSEPTASFYERVGGEPTFRALVDRFYEGVAEDPPLRAMYPEEDLGPAAERLLVGAEAPRLAAHIPGMRECISKALRVQPDQVNVKAKTAERLGPVGQGLAMEARAVALIYKA